VSNIFEIGDFRFDAGSGVLTREGKATALGARAAAVLGALIEHANEYVTKAHLLDVAWPGRVVEDGNLPVQIAAIRRVLAAGGGENWIETLPRRGYRFVGPARTLMKAPAPDTEPRSNLPEATTSFVGREGDLVEIKRLLPTKRLITIVGAGGIGKTRLALQAAAEVISAYRDGVWFVDLGALRDGAMMVTALAQTLGVRERAGTSPIAALCTHLRPLQPLLILDNCEHLLHACADLVDALLKGAAQATIIATSREPLRVAGEQVYSLQPLSLPRLGSSIDAIQCSEAVQLLVERVRRQLLDFELTADRAPVVAELCIHLDGIPLALELAAARARSLSIEQINARLGNRFRLLTSGARGALPRQQTLRATFDWSYDLLAEDERIVLRRLAVFTGSFTLDAACAVAADADIDAFAMIDLLSQLVARSLLIADTNGNTTRYCLLETTRAYAQEKLDESGEIIGVARRRTEHLCKVFASAPRDFLRLPDAELRAIYLSEFHHVRAALDWAFGTEGDAAIGIRLAGTSASLWGTLGLFSEGARRVELALAHVKPGTPESDQALLWRQMGRLVEETPVRARPAFERAAELYRRVDDPLGLGHTLIQLARTFARLGKFDASEATLNEANSLLAEVELPWLHGLYFFNLAFLQNLRGDYPAARVNYERSRVLFLEAGDEVTATNAQHNLANIAWALGDLQVAESSFRQYLTLLRASPMKTNHWLGWSLASLAGVLIDCGKLDEALAAGSEGLPLLLENGSAWMFVNYFALRAALAGRLSDAARLAGYSDHAWTGQEAACHPLDARTRERLHAALHRQLSRDEVERLLAEGAKLSETEACRLALES
jgi:predicted ATPase/DNA-binding winged helix-turn-helix (wHTH) protein